MLFILCVFFISPARLNQVRLKDEAEAELNGKLGRLGDYNASTGCHSAIGREAPKKGKVHQGVGKSYSIVFFTLYCI